MDPLPLGPSQGREGDDVEVRRRQDARRLGREMDPPLFLVPARDAREMTLIMERGIRQGRPPGGPPCIAATGRAYRPPVVYC